MQPKTGSTSEKRSRFASASVVNVPQFATQFADVALQFAMIAIDDTHSSRMMQPTAWVLASVLLARE